MAQGAPIEIRFSGGMNNFNTALDLYLRKKAEVSLLINADVTNPGQIKPLKELNAISAAGTNIHSLFVGNGTIFYVDGSSLKSLSGTIKTGLSSNPASWSLIGNYIFYGNGTNQGCIYIPTKAHCQLGQDVPAAAPTTAAGAAGNPSGDYYCYYRYRITLPDGTIIRTAISPLSTVTVTSQKIEWSGLVHASFEGATTNAIELYRALVGWSALYLVTTLSAGETTYSDDVTDATLQASEYYTEIGYYPPPAGASLAKYYPAADRIFLVIDGDAYWSESGKYHSFLYNAIASEYSSVNSVFLAGEDITAVKIIDENMYFGSLATWRRLRGHDPATWTWEDTAAIMGPINDDSACETHFGIIYPGIDGHMWLFNAFDAKIILEEFQFATLPGSEARATFDGRFYRLFYGDSTYPELIVDFLKYPAVPPRIIQSTRSAIAAFYDRKTAKFYLSDGTYIRNGNNSASEVTTTIKTAEIPPEDLTVFGSMGMLIVRANTQGDDLVITPYIDGKAQSSLTPVNTTSLEYREVPVSFGDCRTLSFLISITSSKAFIIEEPWMLRKE